MQSRLLTWLLNMRSHVRTVACPAAGDDIISQHDTKGYVLMFRYWRPCPSLARTGRTDGLCLLCEIEVLVRSRYDGKLSARVTRAAARTVFDWFQTSVCRFDTEAYGGGWLRQQDAHEMLTALLYAIQSLLRKARATPVVKRLFSAVTHQEVLCHNCGTVSTARFMDSPFSLLLAFRAGESIEQALHRHFSEEVLEGENTYKCDK